MLVAHFTLETKTRALISKKPTCYNQSRCSETETMNDVDDQRHGRNEIDDFED